MKLLKDKGLLQRCYSQVKDVFLSYLLKPRVCPAAVFLSLISCPSFFLKNIDTLERVAGLEGGDLIEAHGTFHTSHCVSFLCRKEFSMDWMKGAFVKRHPLLFRTIDER